MKKLGVWNGVKTWHELNEPAFGHPSHNRLTMTDLGEQPQWICSYEQRNQSTLEQVALSTVVGTTASCSSHFACSGSDSGHCLSCGSLSLAQDLDRRSRKRGTGVESPKLPRGPPLPVPARAPVPGFLCPRGANKGAVCPA